MADQAAPAPTRAFISYSWSSPTHQSWVINLATRLREDGIDVVLDKWDLKPGHDAIAFMEQMVTDATVTKVIMICDSQYAEKADGRAGGVGTESQIISPKIYGNGVQNKFAAAITENMSDGKPYVPTFYAGRIYFDFTVPDREESSYEELLRWLADKPLFVKPALGKIPSFLDSGKIATTATSSRAKRLEESIRNGSSTTSGFFREYSDSLLGEFPKFSVDKDAFEHFDDGVVDAVERFRPYARQFQDVIAAIARYGVDSRTTDGLASFFEYAARFMYRPEDVTSWNSDDFDSYQLIVRDLFHSSMAILLREENFAIAESLLRRPYLIKTDRSPNPDQRSTQGFSAFQEFPRSMQRRNSRLDLRRQDITADFYNKWYKAGIPSFDDMMQADFIMYLSASSPSAIHSMWGRWYPLTLVYATRKFSPFEIFARAESASYFDRIKGLFGASSVEQFRSHIESLSGQNNQLRWDYSTIDPARLANAAQLCAVS